MASSNDGEGLWAPFLRLKKVELPKNFELPKSIDTFFDDKKVLNKPDLASKGLLGLIEYKEQLEHRLMMDHFRRLFVYIQQDDLLELIRPKSSPEARGKPLSLEELNGFLEILHMPKISDQQVVNTINENAAKGAIINRFTAEFGAGCIFFLGNELSEEFLSRCSREEGLEIHKTIEKLTDLGLAEKSKESGAVGQK
ncbi:hypothetical protein G7Y79_00003g010910 [Physcia stellaris]|nr:hypothetical protein G7Y79_00003g010910 [Physcia stellaris]